MNKRALITGITGQDGSYLAELLLNKGYEVHGMVRRNSRGYDALVNIDHIQNRLHLHSGDMSDASSLHRVIEKVMPHELYNLAAQADVMESFFMSEYSLDVNGIGPMRIVEAIRKINPKIRLYQASTSELFGAAMETPQNERTPFNPQSPYAIGKLAGFHAVKKAREMYGIFACNGILFNHESERRGYDYLTRKVTRAIGRIKAGKQKKLKLGNLKAYRDWGYAPEYVEAAWLMLQQDKPDDFVIGTGEAHTVEEWVEESFRVADMGDWHDFVEIDPYLFRPAEVDVLRADYEKAKSVLGWEPRTLFKDLVIKMVNYDTAAERY